MNLVFLGEGAEEMSELDDCIAIAMGEGLNDGVEAREELDRLRRIEAAARVMADCEMVEGEYVTTLDAHDALRRALG
jgi:hypothetical protein